MAVAATLAKLAPKGQITAEQFARICLCFSNLLSLKLMSDALADAAMVDINRLSRLQVLDLSNCSLLTDSSLIQILKLPCLADLSMNKSSGISGNILGAGHDLKPSSCLVSLQLLRMENLADVGFLSLVTCLEKLVLFRCDKVSAEAVEVHLSAMNSLRDLQISGKAVSVSVLETIGLISSLERLDLSSCIKGPSASVPVLQSLFFMVLRLFNLTYLNLSRNVLGGPVLRLICKLDFERPTCFEVKGVTSRTSLTVGTCLQLLSPTCSSDFQLIALKQLANCQVFDELFLPPEGLLPATFALVPFKIVENPVQMDGLVVLFHLVRNSAAVLHALLELEIVPKLLEMLKCDGSELSADEEVDLAGDLRQYVAGLMLAMCGHGSADGLAAVRDSGGFEAAFDFIFEDVAMQPTKGPHIARIFAEIARFEMPQLQDELERLTVVEDLIDQMWFDDWASDRIATLEELVRDCPRNCAIFLGREGVYNVMAVFHGSIVTEDFCRNNACDLLAALVETDRACWQAFCDAGAVEKLTQLLGGPVGRLWGASEGLGSALRALTESPFAGYI